MSEWIYVGVMALVTYGIRMIPLTFFDRKIENQRIRSFLYYMPYAVLSCMTFPAVLHTSDSMVSSVFALSIALIFAYKEKSMLIVALVGCAALYVAQMII